MTKGDRIRRLRVAKGLSQEELSKKLNVSKQAIGKYEKNIVTNIPSDKIEALAEILDSTPEHIMGWETNVPHSEASEQAIFDAKMAKDKDIRHMLKMFMALPDDKKKTIKQMVEDYYDAFA
ncbi:MAG: helix-turn-helix transcriptional regulator [Ruminococcus sp.]|nr:helix-turn-helix transcriptional regulator [Ruminococcus sp.]